MKAEGSGQVIVSLNPFRCRMWALHDRAQEYITEESCREEIISVKKNGQLVPVLGRTLHNDSTHDVELIFGARRLFVARHLNIPIRAEIRAMSDREAIVAMDVENRHRQDISPYERGRSYMQWVREGFFASQEDIASALKISSSQVSRLIKIARLPAVILSAFESPTQICEGWAHELAAVLDDEERRKHMIRKARELVSQSPKPCAREVCRRLLAASGVGRKPLRRVRDQVIPGKAGRALFRIRQTRTCVMLVLPASQVSTRLMKEIREFLQSAMQCNSPVSADARLARIGALDASNRSAERE